jgi:hypothetical protein
MLKSKIEFSYVFKYCTLPNKMFTLSQEIFHVSRATVPVLVSKISYLISVKNLVLLPFL